MLRRCSSILGLPVITDENYKIIGKISKIFISKDLKNIAFFEIISKDLMHSRYVLPTEKIKVIGNDAVIIDDSKCIYFNKKTNNNYITIDSILNKKVYTVNGNNIGYINDAFFELSSSKVEAVEVSDGFIEDVLNGRKIVPFIGKSIYCEDGLFIGQDIVDEILN